MIRFAYSFVVSWDISRDAARRLRGRAHGRRAAARRASSRPRPGRRARAAAPAASPAAAAAPRQAAAAASAWQGRAAPSTSIPTPGRASRGLHVRAQDPDRLPGGRSLGQHVPLPHHEPAVCANKADTSWTKLKNAIEPVVTQLDAEVRFGFTTIYGTDPEHGGGCARSSPARSPTTSPRRSTTRPTSRPNTTASPCGRSSRQHEQRARSSSRRAMYAIERRPPRRSWPTRRRATSTSSSSPTGRRTTATTRSRSARRTPPSARCRPRSPRTSGRSSSVFRRRSSTCPAASWKLSRTPAPGSRRCRPCGRWPRYDRDLRSVPGRHAAGAPTLTASRPSDRRADRRRRWGRMRRRRDRPSPIKPNASNQSMLVTQLSSALAGVKSCVFDLNSIDGSDQGRSQSAGQGVGSDRRERRCRSTRAARTAGT